MRSHRIGRRRFRSKKIFRRNGSNGHSSHSLQNPSNERRFLFRNSQNAPKLLEKYNNLAKEALSSGDKILSENYLQHAEHFLRLIESKNSIQVVKKDDNTQEQTKEESNSKEEKNRDFEESKT